ncbi:MULTISPECIES: MBL fold metallo-hydrolase [Mycobacterium]|uniref:MBL fold metallo-hydrolase n=1 Tax=Mycobacterium gordonae TaxID=1778 RepID=A0A1X1WYX3_MYCGO|nr:MULTISPECIES: MBL fold metallo-hydrolase [Mycobacterium]MCV7004720.1 MBL fold metallo-hydrolase [Mycobacterium gordonae]ODR22575.1 MBL fold metallo-hydrolase [Mycobacterium gordonae]ORV91837.1 MBL fold metallo-hydrolase [Mycobacterium gordonae]PJE17298.1 MAG: MBL fold metallo-hydrolase [Mycobacterium sp.]
MDITITFVGNATTLIRSGDITVLTDPNFLHQGQRAYLGHGLVSKRRKEPALSADQLPPIDAVVLSHMHGDHWDRVTEKHLDRRLPILTTPKAAARLRQKGFEQSCPMSTWQTHTIVKGDRQLKVTSLPGRHAPMWATALVPPVMGSMLEFGQVDGPQRRLYISGDTLLVDELGEIPVRFDAVDAGILHLGGTRLPAGPRLPFGLTVTMDGQQGAGLAELLKLPKAIPVHFDDYTVFASPLGDFTREMARRGLADRVVEIERGGSVSI